MILRCLKFCPAWILPFGWMRAYRSGDRVITPLAPGLNTVLIALVGRDDGTDVRLVVRDAFDLPLNDGSVVACLAPGGPVMPQARFVRGDADANGSINLTDGIVVLNFLFLGQAAPACLDASDTDDDGGERPSLTDAVIIFQWLFSGGVPPREPTPATPTYPATDCGGDPTPDAMGCESPPAICSP